MQDSPNDPSGFVFDRDPTNPAQYVITKQLQTDMCRDQVIDARRDGLVIGGGAMLCVALFLAWVYAMHRVTKP